MHQHRLLTTESNDADLDDGLSQLLLGKTGKHLANGLVQAVDLRTLHAATGIEQQVHGNGTGFGYTELTRVEHACLRS
ncbi:hypothetical protein D3C76_1628500 [compost metagenome]